VIDTKELDLIIRTKLKGRGDIESITKSIKDLEAALEAQAAAAKKGESSYDGLKSSLDGLRTVQEQLAARVSSLRAFEKQGADLDVLSSKVDLAKAKLDEYVQKQRTLESEGKKSTDAQVAQQQKLQAALDRQVAKLDGQRKNYEILGAALKEVGVDTSRLAEEQSRLVEAQLDGAKAIDRAKAEIADYATTVARAREETKKLAQQQALLERFQQGNEADARLGRLQREADAVAEITRQQALAKREAELFAAAEKKAADASAARNKAAQEYAQLQSDRRADNAASRLRDEELRKETERLQFLATLRRDIEERSTVAARNAQQLKAETELLAAAEKKAADAAAARAKAYAQFDETQRNRRAEATALNRQAEEEQRALERQRELAALRRDIQDRSAVAVRDTGLTKTADDAERAAKGYSTLARASNDLRPRVVSLREAIQQINDPSRKATESLGALEQNVGALASKVASIKGPVQDYADTLQQLEAAQKSLSQQGGLVDRYNRELAALKANRAELVAARTQVAQYAAAVRQGGDAGEAFVKPLAEAEARLKRAAVAMREQTSATRDSRDALRAAGINTANLAQEQLRLVNVAKTATGTIQQLSQSYEQNGEAVGKAAKAKGLFRDEGRTTLSLAQRLRGEILALAAAYVGLQGVVSLAGGSIDAFNTREGVKNQLAISVGNDRKLIDEEYAYVKAQSERIGIEFETAIRNYAKFSASATLAGRSRQEIRFIFEAFAEVGRVANLSAGEIDGVFKAIEQSVSKGKIQAEELRGQLGDRLFGAFQVAAKALRDQFPDLDKALEKGQVTSEQLVLIANEYKRTVEGGLAGAIGGLSANQARLNNAVNEFKLAIADGGFADSFLRVVQQITEFLRSEDGDRLAKSIATGFTAVLDTLSFLLANLTEVKALAGAIFALFAINIFGAVAANALTAAVALKGVATQLTLIQKAMAVLAAFALGWNFGAYMREKFVEVELFGIALVRGLLEGFTKLKAGTLEIFFELPRFAANAFKQMINLFNNVFATPFIRVLRDIASAAGFDSVASAFDRALRNMNLSLNMEVSSNTAALRDQAAKDLAAIRSITDEMADEAIGRRVRTGGTGTGAKATTAPDVKGGRKPTGPTEAEIKRRQSEIEQLTKALETLEAKIDRTQTDTLSKQLEAIDTEYQALARRIGKLGGEEGKRFLERLETGVSQLKLQITKKFNDKLLDEQNAILAKVEAAEAASGRKQKGELDTRLEAITKSYEATYRQIADQRAKLVENGRDTSANDESKRRLDAAVLELQNAERLKFLNDDLARRQREITDAVKSRADFIEAIKDQEAAGALTRLEAEQRIRDEVSRTQPVIDQLVAAGLLFAESMGGAFDSTRVEQFRAALIRAKGSGEAIKTEMNLIGQTLTKSVNAAIDTFIEGIGDAASGTKSWGDVFRGVGRSILSVIGNVLAELIKTQIRMLILKAITASFGGGPAPMEAATGAQVFHSGGIVGRPSGRSRSVSPAWFAGAPRYHSGGVVGLAPDEYPAILQKGEEVLSASNPRNVMNGAVQGGVGSSSKGTRFVLVDDRSRVAEAMAGAEGEEVIVQHLRKNIATVRAMVRG